MKIKSKMNAEHFLHMERHIHENYTIDKDTIYRRIRNRLYAGKEIPKLGCQLYVDRLEKMAEGANKKYQRNTNDIIKRIQNAKRKGITKYQTLGYKQAKEIKKWCQENNIDCSIVCDNEITRKKLTNIDVWFESNWQENFGTDQINFVHKRQNVVYIQIKK